MIIRLPFDALSFAFQAECSMTAALDATVLLMS
jgi:hypothetical protein